MKNYTPEQMRLHIAGLLSGAASASQAQTAKALGISAAYLSDIINGRRDISANVARKFGFERHATTTTFFTKRKP